MKRDLRKGKIGVSAALYWFKALFWNISWEDTGNVNVVGVLDARA